MSSTLHSISVAESDEVANSQQRFEVQGRRVGEKPIFSSFVVNETVFPVDEERYLYLRSPLKIVLESDLKTVCVVDWPIRMGVDRFSESYGGEVVRTYLTLLSKAEADLLTQEEKKVWLTVSRYVDYRSFRYESEPARYLEGRLVGVSEHHVKVKWHDETESLVSRRLVEKACRWLKDGDYFSAWIKFDLNHRVERIERISLIAKEVVESEEDIEGWLPEAFK